MFYAVTVAAYAALGDDGGQWVSIKKNSFKTKSYAVWLEA